MENWLTYLGNFFNSFLGVAMYFELACASLDAVLCAGHLHLNKKDMLHFLIGFVSVFVPTFVLVMLAYSLTPYMDGLNFSQYIIILGLILPGTLYLTFFEHVSWRHKLIKVLMFVSSAFVVTEVSHHTNVAVNLSQFEDGLREFCMAMPHLLMLISGFLVGFFNVNRFENVSYSHVLISALSFTGVLIIAFLLGSMNPVSASSEVIYIVVLLAFLITECGIYIFIYFSMKKLKEELERHTQETLNRAASEMVQLNQKSIEQVTIARHDVKNHFSYLQSLLEQGKYDDAKNYIAQYNNNLFEEMHVIDCGNPVISSIMNLELSKAKTANVKLKYFLAVPATLSILESDLCSLITNLVDNAIEGYCKDSDDGIEVRIVLREKCLRILVKNPTDKKKATLVSTKPESGHGMGTRIVKNIVRKYNGYIKFDVVDGYFVADSIMNLDA